MIAENKFFETGSNPYYLNLENTAKDFSFNDLTNPQWGLLDTLSKFIVIENDIIVEEPQLLQGFFIETL